ncbi:unnamed protein product [Callosobruchus maculatus]|uniref:SH3 domain-containing protein n=1 Tax=Callosobruchus maculatus TaxID=64391 RepID=A0A653CVI5_CALMS|nr:unnamed protein product [Callosobruchus maculatus]
MEAQRLNFFKGILFEIHKYLNIESNLRRTLPHNQQCRLREGPEMVVEQLRRLLDIDDAEVREEGSGRSATYRRIERLHEICSIGNVARCAPKWPNDSNPFEEEDWEENDALVDNGEPGVPVKALYDYEGAENDELSFKTGRTGLV